ncbi:MAG: hypothetical protein KJZ91_06935 [Myxococcales bacterium]|nr:hypothetical protein [Myxococcales bacterium]
MALKSTYASEEKGAEIEEALDVLDKLVDRVKVLYEQYFMGIQKQAPAHLHNDAERRIRDLAQMNIRNTALRYRLATIQQKYGAYNTYWKRTLREIEAGRYIRNLQKVRRQAQLTGEEIPEEILAKMPKRMREAVVRDRAQALAKAAREGMLPDGAGFDDDLGVPDDTQPELRFPAVREALAPGGAHRLDDGLGDGPGDIADMLTALADEALAAVESRSPAPAAPRSAGPTRPAGKPGAAARRAPASDTIPSPPPELEPDVAPAAAPRATPSAVADRAGAPPLRPPVPTGPPPVRPGPPTGAPPLRPPVPTGPPPVRPVQATMPPPSPTGRATPPTGTPPVRATPAQGSATPRPQGASGAAWKPAPAGGGAGASPPRTGPSPIPGMSEADTRALYARYIKARQVVGEKTDPMSYDKLVRTLSSQAPKILEQHKAAGVEFNVVIKDNKVVLKAKPK